MTTPAPVRPAVPAEVARLLSAGMRRGAAELLADELLDGEITREQADAALAQIAPHLQRSQRELIFHEDVCSWVDEVRYAYETGGPRARVGSADPDTEVNRALSELTGWP